MPKKILVAGIGLLLIVFSGLAFFSFLLGPTHGSGIAGYQEPRKALLVIDMQEDYLGKTARPPFPYKHAGILVNRVNDLIGILRKRGFLIIYVRQEFEGLVGRTIAKVISNGSAVKGAPGTSVDSRLVIKPDTSFGKPKGDSFSNPDFERYCIKNNINELVLCGLDGEFCIYHTIIGAADRGYKVSVVKDAVAFKNERKKETLFSKYEKHGCRLLTYEELTATEAPDNSNE